MTQKGSLNMNVFKLITTALACTLGLTSLPLWAAKPIPVTPPYSVKVDAQREFDGVLYRYTVTSNSVDPVMGIYFGVRAGREGEEEMVPQLLTEPAGLTEGQCGEVGCFLIVPEASHIDARGWHFNFTTVQDSLKYMLEWGIGGNDLDAGIEPLKQGQTLEFAFKLQHPDPTYSMSDFMMHWSYADGRRDGNVFGKMMPSDTVAPKLTLSVNTTELTGNAGEYLPINASVAATDRADKTPTVWLYDIRCLNNASELTASDPLRVNIVYDAGDSCVGNGAPYFDSAQFDTRDTSFRLMPYRVGEGREKWFVVRYVAMDATGNASYQRAVIHVPAKN